MGRLMSNIYLRDLGMIPSSLSNWGWMEFRHGKPVGYGSRCGVEAAWEVPVGSLYLSR